MKFPWATDRSACHEAAGDPATADERTRRKGSWLRLRNVMAIPLAGAIGIGGFGCASSLNSHSGRAASEIAAPLHTNGGSIVDAAGRTVTITGVNWFGFETSTFAPHGLWARNDAIGSMTVSNSTIVENHDSSSHFTFNFVTTAISVTVQPSLAGRSFTVDGTNYTSAQTFNWPPGASHCGAFAATRRNTTRPSEPPSSVTRAS